MKRRDFLKLSAISGVALSLFRWPLKAFARTPKLTLWADGQHDDTEALQAFLNGNRVNKPDGKRVPENICGGRFLITATIITKNAEPFKRLSGCSFIWGGRPDVRMFAHTEEVPSRSVASYVGSYSRHYGKYLHG